MSTVSVQFETPMPEDMDEALWAVLPERLRNYVVRHPEKLRVVDMAIFRHLPAFVDQAWVRSKIATDASALESVHRRRRFAREVVSLTDWPDSAAIDADDLALIHLQAMRIPHGTYLLNRAYGRNNYEETLDPLDISAGFRASLAKALKAVDKLGLKSDDGDPTVAEVCMGFLAADDLVGARDYAFFSAMFFAVPLSHIADVYDLADGRLDDVRDFHRAIEEFQLRFVVTNGGSRAFDKDLAEKLARLPRVGIEAAALTVAGHGTYSDFSFLVTDLDNEGIRPVYRQAEASDVEPKVVLPSFVDRGWLMSGRLALSGAVRSQLHQERETFLAHVDRPGWWPDRKPSADDIADRFLDALRFPHTLTAINLDVLPKDGEPVGQWDNSPFRPAYKRVAGVLRGEFGIKLEGGPDGNNDAGVLRALIQDGHIELAAEFALLRGAELFDEDFVEIIAQEGVADEPQLAEVSKFLVARRRLKNWAEPRIAPGLLDSYRRLAHVEIPALDPNALPCSRLRHSDAPTTARGRKTITKVEISMEQEATEDHAPISPLAVEVAEAAYAVGETWISTLVSVSETAREIAQSEPSLSALERIEALLRDAAATARAWDDLRPKRVEAAPYLDRLNPLRVELVRIVGQSGSEHRIADMPEVETIDPAEIDAVDKAVTLAEAHVGQATEAGRAAVELNDRWAAEPLLLRKAALNTEMSAASGALVARLDEGVASFEQATLLLASAASERTTSEPAAPVREPAPAAVPEIVEPPVEEPAPAVPAFESAEPVAIAEPSRDEPVEDEPRVIEMSDAVGGFADDDLVGGNIDFDLIGSIGVGADADADVEPEQNDAVSGEVVRIDERLISLAGSGQFGLAFHLATAAKRLHPGTTFAVRADEMRFVAAAGRLDHAFLQTSPDNAKALVWSGLEALEGVPASSEGAHAAARRILMYPTALEIALFHPDSGADALVRTLNGLVDEIQEPHAALVDAVVKITSNRLPLSPSVLAHVGQSIEATSSADAMRQLTLDRIDQFERGKFNFLLGVRVRVGLYQNDGLVGRLREAFRGKDMAGADEIAGEFIKATEKPALIIDLFDDTAKKLGRNRGQVDGPARDRMLSHIEGIRDAAALYVSSRHAAKVVSSAEMPQSIRKAVSDLRGRLGKAVAALEELRQSAEDGFLAAAAGHAAERYRALDVVLKGEAPAVPGIAHRIALHATLPLLRTLQFGRSWFPSPYEAPVVLQTILDAPYPMLPEPGPERDAAYAAIVRHRILDGSIVGARLLIDIADAHLVSPDAIEEIKAIIGSDEDTARKDLADEINRARDVIERVMRFGSLSRPEEAQRLLSIVDRVAESEVPVAVAVADRTEEVDVERVYDVKTASDLLSQAVDEARLLLDEPRNRLLARIEAMVSADRLSNEDARHLRSLCAEDDLQIAEEMIQTAEKHGTLAGADQQKATRIEILENEILPNASQSGRGFVEAAASAIAAGTDLPGAPFSQLSQERRGRSSDIFAAWRELFRHVEGGMGGNAIAEEARAFFEALGIDLTLREVPKGLSSAQRRLFVADWEGSIPTDAESRLLPDFGSLTQGAWRTAFSTTLPGDAVLKEIAPGSTMGTMLLVAEVVPLERRERFLLQNLAAKRRVILIDAASLVQTLAEPELRALTAIELGQSYSYSKPYLDYGKQAVPPELFVGRRRELETLYEAAGSCVVYGGRRIGKTALLKHLVTTRNNPEQGVLVGFLDVQDIGSVNPPVKIWDEMQKALPSVFPKRLTGEGLADKVSNAIRTWLNADARRRIVVLIDEADNFVSDDAAKGYAVFHQLHSLMASTGRRFKFVLSGLHNVTRVARLGNSPIAQISSDPQRIGPLMGSELADAQDLVERPFAALGIRFEQRKDIWRILSHANYMPVLVQVLGSRLLNWLVDDSVRSDRRIRSITSSMVSRLFEDREVRDEVKGKFMLTLGIDPRYELLAYAVADLVLGNQASGAIEEGVPLGMIRDRAVAWWPKGFADPDRTSLFEGLVDEAEGLGVMRQVGNRWTLRSTAILRLLGTREEIDTKLLEFGEREAPKEFDPKSARRQLEPAVGFEKNDRRPSPLTLVQEHDLITDPTQVKLVFGTAIADVDLVSLALRSATESFSEGNRYEVIAQIFGTQKDLTDRIVQSRGGDRQKVVIVDFQSPWTPAWIGAVLKTRPVVEKAVKVVFVGGPDHAALYASDRGLRTASNQIKAMPLEPWSTTFTEDQLQKANAIVSGKLLDDMHRSLGGWNGPLSSILQTGRGDRVAGRVEKIAAELDAAPDTMLRLGIQGRYAEIVGLLAAYGYGTQDSQPFHARELAEVIGELNGTAAASNAADAEDVIAYGVLIGAFQPIAGSRGDDKDGHAYLFAPLVGRLAKSSGRKEGA